MDFKLDENLGRSIQKLFHERGHDCLTVREENLSGADDDEVFRVTRSEKRILVTLDHHFGNVLRFPPHMSDGIALLNPPGKLSLSLVRVLVNALLDMVSTQQIQGKLWIIEPGRVREHEPDSRS